MHTMADIEKATVHIPEMNWLFTISFVVAIIIVVIIIRAVVIIINLNIKISVNVFKHRRIYSETVIISKSY